MYQFGSAHPSLADWGDVLPKQVKLMTSDNPVMLNDPASLPLPEKDRPLRSIGWQFKSGALDMLANGGLAIITETIKNPFGFDERGAGG